MASAGAIARQDAGEVARPVAEQRHRLPLERCQHELADRAVRNGLEGIGVDDLDDVVVLPDVHAVLLGALEGNAGAAHLRHAEGVVSLDAKHVLNALARILGVRLGTDHEGTELGVLAGIDSLFAHDFIKACRVRRDGVHHGGAEVREKLELAEGVSSRGRDGQHAHLLSTVLEAKAAGEHPVAGGVLEHVLRAAAHHPQAAGDRIGPFIQILLRMQDDRGIAGGAAG